jgi:hypothetical protein
MTTTYTWLVEYMSCYPQAEGETDVVFQVNWTCSAENDATPPASAGLSGTISVTYVAGDPYTPYADLTQEQVLGWVWAVTPEADVQAYLDDQISAVNLPLPWSA